MMPWTTTLSSLSKINIVFQRLLRRGAKRLHIAEACMRHKDLRFEFKVTDTFLDDGETRRYEAVGFLAEDEQSIPVGDMFARVPDVVGEDDLVFLRNAVEDIPFDPRWAGFVLVGDYKPAVGTHLVSYFTFDHRWTQIQRRPQGRTVDRRYLVLRRLVRCLPNPAPFST